MNKKLLSILCVFVLMFMTIHIPSNAATGKQGYAVYRNGVTTSSIDISWHAAIMDKASKDDIYPVIHAPGSSVDSNDPSDVPYVRYDHWYEFMAGTSSNPYINNDFTGYYAPMTSISSSQRDAVVATARAMASDFVEYAFFTQVNYDVGYNPNNKTIVSVSDIISVRCDGVVEYCYEFNNIRICGGNTYWNISKWGTNYWEEHSNEITINPYTQAENYMQCIQVSP